MAFSGFRKGALKAERNKIKPVRQLCSDPSESGRSRRMGAGRPDHDRAGNLKNTYAHISILTYSSFFPDPQQLPLQQEQNFLQQIHKNAAHMAR
jgi:hypothetical protein